MVRISRTWGQAADWVGIKLADKHRDLCLTKAEAFVPFQAGEITADEYFSELAREFSLSPDQAATLHAGILREPYPGTLPLVTELHDRGFQTGCLSNTNAPHWHLMRSLERFPAVALIEHTVLSHEVRADKPNPEIYAAFEQKSGAKGSEILFFDDAFENVVAARNKGWFAEVIDPYGDTAAQMRAHLERWVGK